MNTPNQYNVKKPDDFSVLHQHHRNTKEQKASVEKPNSVSKKKNKSQNNKLKMLTRLGDKKASYSAFFIPFTQLSGGVREGT